MKTFIRKCLTLTLSLIFLAAQAQAQSSSYLGVQKFDQDRGAEYVSGNQPGTVLMRVNLWGAVRRPGIHHIPVKSDLMSLFSYAGGPNKDAILDEVIIKREEGTQRKLIRIDVEELIEGVSHHHIELAPNDIVVVPEDEPLVDRDTLYLFTTISIVLSSILTAIYITNQD